MGVDPEPPAPICVTDPEGARVARGRVFDAICKKTELTPDMLRILPPARVIELLRAEKHVIPNDAPVGEWLKEYAESKTTKQ